jgi:hypothetical protein
MPTCHLSKNQALTSSHFSYHLKNSHKFYALLHCQLVPSLKSSKALKSRHISPESYTLPFQVHAKFFHAPPTQASENIS